jgi:hypothetical protein
MGRKNETGNATSLVDQYRKQLGRQEKKVVNERRKEIKRLKSEQEDVSYWKVGFCLIKKKLIFYNSIISEYFMDIGCCVIYGFYYLYFIDVLFNPKRFVIKKNWAFLAISVLVFFFLSWNCFFFFESYL